MMREQEENTQLPVCFPQNVVAFGVESVFIEVSAFHGEIGVLDRHVKIVQFDGNYGKVLKKGTMG
jgi:F0F1-type ATP synthase epsilon subunit